MDYILIYDSEGKNQWMYISSVNDGCYIYSSLDENYERVISGGTGDTKLFHDIESYTRYAELVNNLPTGRLYYEQPNLPYEFW